MKEFRALKRSSLGEEQENEQEEEHQSVLEVKTLHYPTYVLLSRTFKASSAVSSRTLQQNVMESYKPLII